jgi:hypothetical protein
MENEISLCVPKPTGKCKIPMGKRKNNFPGSSDKEKENCLSVLSPTRKTTPSVFDRLPWQRKPDREKHLHRQNNTFPYQNNIISLSFLLTDRETHITNKII